ncbi:PcfJ domain-containing protein [Vibrio splendidus]|uniref:PcfJ domain-containing protein n=3 Tax=Vibrio TaxID=662 RepID=A0AA43FUI6_VIBSP|nr:MULTISPECIES: PcfJ domain-containing protein [Vibrio]MDH5919776.1 PcfJ domain-containing protein [Vibrio splendidus]TCN05578.1 PcfJ-like protein [Vibrio crassostreae]TCT54157.1 PcfJ-like protein [Vibrio crassostreae]TCU01586.1 PcfJ-like protein [Vibrio crassostreae]CAK1798808.1 PcfJ-like protein [Vibrio crassostreae]
MSSLTVLPPPQVLLSSTMASFHGMDGEQDQLKVLPWQTLYRFLNDQPWRRMVKREQDGALDTLVLAGLFRLVKHPNQKVTMQRLSLTWEGEHYPQWSWVGCQYLPDLMMQSFQSSLAGRFYNILEYVIGALLTDLEKQGIQALTVPVKAPKKGDYDGMDTTPVPIAYLDMGKTTKQWILERFGKQFGFLEEGIKQGGRSLYKHLWDFVDKEKLSLYLQIYQCSLSQVSFGCLHSFSHKVKDVSAYKRHRVWLPWLSVLPGGVNSNIHPNVFSYEHLLAYLPVEVSKGVIRKINRQPRKVQALLIEARMWAPSELSLLDALTGYSTTIQVGLLSIIRDQKERHCHHGVLDFERLQRVVFRWAQYFKPMIGRVKVRKQKEQWRRALIQFNDVFDWVEREDAVIHKNQSWYALVQQHERWVARMNADRLKVDAQMDVLTWERAEWEAFDTQGIKVEEITTGLGLRREGREMEHCVFSYLDDCVKQRYRVFTLTSNAERATLGLYQDSVSRLVQYDQLRGARNDLSSQAIEQVAKQLIETINKTKNEGH